MKRLWPRRGNRDKHTLQSCEGQLAAAYPRTASGTWWLSTITRWVLLSVLMLAADRLLRHIPKLWCVVWITYLGTKWPGIKTNPPPPRMRYIWKQWKKNKETDMRDRDISTQNMLMIPFFRQINRNRGGLTNTRFLLTRGCQFDSICYREAALFFSSSSDFQEECFRLVSPP